MIDAVIVSTARTPIGKAHRGAFNMTHGAVMGAHALSHAVSRAGIEPGEVEDVILGCGYPEGATLPVHFDADREVLDAALSIIGTRAAENARVMRIRNTMLVR